MLIRNIEIENFRSIRSSSIETPPLTALVGRNGSGKSSFLHAIDVFYNIASPITEEDFFDRVVERDIVIRVTYSHLTQAESDEFKAYVKNNELRVTKRITFQDGKFQQNYYGAALQIPEFASLRAEKGRERINAHNKLVTIGRFKELNKIRREADSEPQLQECEQAHTDLLQPIDRPEQFFGPRNIGGGKLDKFTRFVLIPAVKELSEELEERKGTSLQQLLDLIVLRQVNARKDIQEFKARVDKEIKSLYSSDNLKELPQLGVSISNTLEQFSPGAALSLKWGLAKLPEVRLPAVESALTEDGFEGAIDRKGHGLQRALIMTLLQHLALLSQLSNDDPQEEAVADEGTRATLEDPDLIIAIEEPELYLHPLRCKHISQLLWDLCHKPGIGIGARNQVLYATHSPHFIDLHRFGNVRHVQKASAGGSAPGETNAKAFSIQQAARERARVTGKKITEDSFQAHSLPIMNTIVNEGFFADVVVLVEGPSDAAILWTLSHIMDCKWTEQGIAVIPVGGKESFDRPFIIFTGFDIPVYVVFDGDAQENTTKTASLNRKLLTLVGATPEDFPGDSVNSKYAVFHNTLDTKCRELVGERIFKETIEKLGDELEYSSRTPEKLFKKEVIAAGFVRAVYDQKITLPILEETVNAITSLIL